MSFDVYLITAYVAAIVVFLATPGPVTVLVINASIRGGFRAGLLTTAGTNISSLLLIAFSFLIIKGLFAIDEQALTLLSLLGSVYLIYFALSILRSDTSLDRSTTAPSASYFKSGFIVGISNPKDILFFVAFFPQFLGVTNSVNASVIILTIVWVLLDYALLSLYAALCSRDMGNGMANLINKTSGCLLLGVALYALYSAVKSI